MSDFITHIPSSLPEIISCKHCGVDNNIPWGQKSKEPFIPVTPNDFDPISNNKIWVPSGLSFPCRKCHSPIYLELPQKRQTTELHLFGDESYDSNSNIFTYTLTGADFKALSEIENKIFLVKSRILPKKDPRSWTIHMKDLWSTTERANNPTFKGWTLNQVWTLINAITELLESLDNDLFVYSITMTKHHPFNSQSIEQAKYNCYTMLILNVIEEATDGGAQPRIYFDSEKNSSSDHIIHRWANETFRSAQRQLIYTYLAKGITIPEPQFIKPASHPCSELSDFLSFWIRRYHLKSKKGEQTEVELKKFGNITYYGFTNTGEFLRIRQRGYPWKQFYKRTG